MTVGRKLSGFSFTSVNLLTTVNFGDKFLKPPRGNLGDPVTNKTNFFLKLQSRLSMNSIKFLKVWL